MSTLILIFAGALLFAVSATPGARWLALKLGIVGRQFGKLVVGLEGAPQVEGVVHVRSAAEALARVALYALGREPGSADRG